MRRFLLLGAVAALLTGAGVASSSQGNVEPLDYVAGGGGFPPGCFDGPDVFCIGARRDFSIDAHSGPKGQNATGVSFFSGPTTTFPRREVLCLRVDGNRAVVGGTFVHPTLGLSGWAMLVEDNGPPGPGPDDRTTPTFADPIESWGAGFPKECPPFDADFFVETGFQPLDSGDIVVHDGLG